MAEIKYTYLPLVQATETPGDGFWEIYADRWWVHYQGKGLAFFRGSPQCNSNESIARKVQKAAHPDADLIFIARAYVRHDCGRYV